MMSSLFQLLLTCSFALKTVTCQGNDPIGHSPLLLQATKIFKDHLKQASSEAAAFLTNQGIKGEDLVEALQVASDHALAQEKMVSELHSFQYADRHILRVEELVHDQDCMSREFDLQDPNFRLSEAAAVLEKCRLLVVRNVHSPNVVAAFKAMHAPYVNNLKKTSSLDRKKRVLNDAENTRYEILVPKAHYVRELAENPTILELLDYPRLLDDNIFIHSFGTSITEPGTPHQAWHEEDNYLFSSFDSFLFSGVGGHDLPPHTINMFSPLLNLTYDHGPTEFCMGTSHLTGLYSTFDFNTNKHNPPVPTFDPDLLQQAPNFSQLWAFGLDTLSREYQVPCPPQFLRSALLNVGDVVLFDYQILHRAGHNLSNQTRAQMYIAYARTWFRDLNYHVNTDGKGNDGTEELWIHTRFAPPPRKHEPQEPVELETMRDIIPLRKASPSSEPQRLFVSATDLDVGTFISVNGSKVGEMTEMPTALELHVPVGSDLTVHSPLGDPVKSWEIPMGMSQLMVSKAILGISEGYFSDDISSCANGVQQLLKPE